MRVKIILSIAAFLCAVRPVNSQSKNIYYDNLQPSDIGINTDEFIEIVDMFDNDLSDAVAASNDFDVEVDTDPEGDKKDFVSNLEDHLKRFRDQRKDLVKRLEKSIKPFEKALPYLPTEGRNILVYLKAYKKYIETLSDLFEQYAETKIQLVEVNYAKKKIKQGLNYSFARPDKPEIKNAWKAARTEQVYKAFDLILEDESVYTAKLKFMKANKLIDLRSESIPESFGAYTFMAKSESSKKWGIYGIKEAFATKGFKIQIPCKFDTIITNAQNYSSLEYKSWSIALGISKEGKTVYSHLVKKEVEDEDGSEAHYNCYILSEGYDDAYLTETDNQVCLKNKGKYRIYDVLKKEYVGKSVTSLDEVPGVIK